MHPELEDLILVNAEALERIDPNGIPVRIDNDLFEGVFLAMFRTSEADSGNGLYPCSLDAADDDGDASNCSANRRAQFDPCADYFREKQRMFEFQYQLKLKKVPTGRVYMAVNLDQPVQLGIVQRAFINACLCFVQSRNSGFHYSMGSENVLDEARRAGKYEKTHIAFPVDCTMDRLVSTKPGQSLPKLGEEIKEDLSSIERRKKGGLVDWNTDDTYTMALWSAHTDFLQWRLVNFPGVVPFSLCSIAGPQFITLDLYCLRKEEDMEIDTVGTEEEEDRDRGWFIRRQPSSELNQKERGNNHPHFECNKDVFIQFELSKRDLTSLGPYAQRLLTGSENGNEAGHNTVIATHEIHSHAASTDALEGIDECCDRLDGNESGSCETSASIRIRPKQRSASESVDKESTAEKERNRDILANKRTVEFQGGDAKVRKGVMTEEKDGVCESNRNNNEVIKEGGNELIDPCKA